jgi:hypothetical protein
MRCSNRPSCPISSGTQITNIVLDRFLTTIPINNTVFVDQVFGTATGKVEDLAHPFQTLTQGLAAALDQNPSSTNPWTIYVQPGTYITPTLVLQDGINFFFTEGTIISNTSGPLFIIDTGSSTISGYAEFEISDSLILITGAASVDIEAKSIVTNTPSNTTSIFNIASVLPSSLIVNMDSINHVQTSPILLIDGAATVDFNVEQVVAAGIFIRSTTNASGAAFIHTLGIEGGDPTQTGLGNTAGALIINQSDRFILQVITQLFRSHSLTQAIQSTVINPPIGPTQQNSVFVQVQELFADGGITYASGLAPLDPFNQVFAPKISLHAQFIEALTLDDVVLFYCEEFAITNIVSDIIFERYQLVGAPISAMAQSVDGIMFFKTNIIAALTNIAFIVDSTPFASGSLTVDSLQIFCALSLLQVGGNSSAVINSDVVVCFGGAGAGPGILIDTTSSVQLDIKQLQLQVVGGAMGAEIAAIDLISGSLSMAGFSYNYGGDFSYGIRKRTGANGLIVDVNQINGNGSPTTVFYLTDGNALLKSDQINSGGAVIVQNGNNNLKCCITDINAQNTILNISDGSSIQGYVGTCNCQNGLFLESSTTNLINLIFNSIQAQNGAQCINVVGQGTCYLSGNTINTQNCDVGINIGDQSSNTPFVLKVEDLIFGNGGTITSGIMVNSGSASIDYQRLFVNGNTTSGVIRCVKGATVVRGTTSDNLQSDFIMAVQDAMFTGYFGSVSSNGIILTISTTNQVWYEASSSVCNGSNQVINITAPATNPSYTVGGYMSTQGNNCIVINGPNTPNFVRVLSSDLVSNGGGNCIVGLGFGVGPFPKVIIEPSISNTFAANIAQVPDPTIVLPPYGSLIVDANVQ